MKSLVLPLFLLYIMGCSKPNEKSKLKYEIVYNGVVRYDNAKTLVVFVPDINKDSIKSQIPILIKNIAEDLGTNDFSVEFLDQKDAAIALEENYKTPRARTRSELDSLDAHSLASYDGGLQSEGKPAFTYLYELNYLQGGNPIETLEFKPLN